MSRPTAARRPARFRSLRLALVVPVVLTAMVALAGPAAAAVTTSDLTGGVTAADLAGRLVGDGITVSNAAFSGSGSAAGLFLGGSGILGLDAGVVLSSGDIANVIGPNDSTGAETQFFGPGDPDLDVLAGTGTQDAAVLTFDFVPLTSTVRFDYVFSSEEYTEFIGAGFNDAFGFFVNGSNCALAGDPAVPITVDTINPSTNGSLYIDNAGGARDTQMDGLTVVLTCTASVTPNATNTMKLAIADAGDARLDSAVFLGQGTFSAVHPLTVTADGDGAGRVTSVPAGIDCGEDCTEGYEEGTSVSLSAVADEGSTFVGWSGGCAGTGACELTINGPRSVTATFDTIDPDPCPPATDCDGGTVPPGGTFSTVEGGGSNPVTTGDPFALELKNVTGDPLTGTIVEEACDGTQVGDPLCSSPRVGGSAGNFQFSTGGGGTLAITTSSAPPPVTVAKLYYDRSVIRVGAPIKIFYQKTAADPVIRLARCDDGVRTECFTVKKLASGDQIVKVPLSADPRVTRG